MLLVEPIGRVLELPLGLANLRVKRRGEDPLLVGALVGELLQLLHQLQFAAGGEAVRHGFGSRTLGSTIAVGRWSAWRKQLINSRTRGACGRPTGAMRVIESSASLTTGPRGSK